MKDQDKTTGSVDLDAFWEELRRFAIDVIEREPALASLLHDTVIDRANFAESLTYRITRKLANHAASVEALHTVFLQAFTEDPKILEQVILDIQAVCDRDPACDDALTPLLYFKGFQSLVCYRVAHFLWNQDRKEFALYLQSLISETFSVDIHPAAKLAGGILLDHATGFVAGETAVIEQDVSILHEVTLGGTGKDRGDRHPKVRSGVLLGAGAKILGNVEIGTGAKVGAGSVVLNDVPAHTSVAGVPAKVIGKTSEVSPALGMCHELDS
ncbi:MAG: serine O-acetyltransferase [Verrucomicrobia bacterium]|nr:serine O-acetyltransferase [Verrucomicrobiota bacterium]